MRIKFNAYKKRDGEWMVYANNDRRVSVGISARSGIPAPYGKRTSAGQRNLIYAIPQAINAAEELRIEGTPNFDAHPEGKVRLEIGDLYITDVATIGGVSTGADGAFLVTKSGKCFNLCDWIAVED